MLPGRLRCGFMACEEVVVGIEVSVLGFEGKWQERKGEEGVG